VSDAASKLGASESLVSGEWTWPVQGMRHPSEADTSGWYWWSGEWSDADDFFLSWHAVHLVERCPRVAEFLDAPPGTRVLLGPGYVDVWTDKALLDI
jgi:hypothetical protein